MASLDGGHLRSNAFTRLRMAVHWDEKSESVPTYLPSLLILANGTGRRISAICSLKFADLRPSLGPHGSIRWPADTDKMGLESVVPVTREVREVLDRIQRERPGMGAAPLFPGPKNPGAPIRYELASTWLLEAERLAGLPKQRRVALACVQEKVGRPSGRRSPTSMSRLREDGRARVRSSSSISAPTRPRCTRSSQRGRSSSRSWARPNRWEARIRVLLATVDTGAGSPDGMTPCRLAARILVFCRLLASAARTLDRRGGRCGWCLADPFRLCFIIAAC